MSGLYEISNNKIHKKYYKIMEIHEKSLGQPKMCSNYTWNFENTAKIEKRQKYPIISKFFQTIAKAGNFGNSKKTCRIS